MTLSSPVLSDVNEKPTNNTFAGFWVRIASHFFDMLIILLVLAPIIALDVYVMEGDPQKQSDNNIYIY